MIRKCKQCQQEFEAGNKGTGYCGMACRKEALKRTGMLAVFDAAGIEPESWQDQYSEPTEEQEPKATEYVWQAAKAIRENWSKEELEERGGGKSPEWRLPELETSERVVFKPNVMR